MMAGPPILSLRQAGHPPTESIGKEEFCDRFVESMIVRASHATFPNGCAVVDYATETSESYWRQAALRKLGPERCVVSDMRHWHETWG